MMASEQNQALKAHVMGWKETGAILEAERRDRVRGADTALALRNLGSLFDSAVLLHPPNSTSGLVDFYDLLKKSRPLEV
jgi:hypothetical protein